MIGPTALVDKSAFQMLTSEESLELTRYFFQVLPTVLISEIIADLELSTGSEESNRKKVTSLAKKFWSSGPPVMEDYRDISLAELSGAYGIPMTGQIMPQGATFGGGGMFVDLTPYNHAIMRWNRGIFNDEDKVIAENWRKTLTSVSTEDLGNIITDHKIFLPRATTIEQVKTSTNSIINNPHLQEPLLRWYTGKLNLSRQVQRQIIRKWQKSRVLMIRYFAPYAAFCIKAMLSLYIAERNTQIPPRPTNIIDLQYLFYLPFCQAFISDDTVHKRIAPILMRDDQVFITGQEMKTALAAQSAMMTAPDDSKRLRLKRALSIYPFPISNNMVTTLWAKYMRKWGRGSAGLDDEASQEEKEEAYAEVERLFKEAGLETR